MKELLERIENILGGETQCRSILPLLRRSTGVQERIAFCTPDTLAEAIEDFLGRGAFRQETLIYVEHPKHFELCKCRVGDYLGNDIYSVRYDLITLQDRQTRFRFLPFKNNRDIGVGICGVTPRFFIFVEAQ